MNRLSSLLEVKDFCFCFSNSNLSPLLSAGASGVGELLANTLAVRNVTVIVLDIKPITSENCEFPWDLVFSMFLTDSFISQYHVLQV